MKNEIIRFVVMVALVVLLPTLALAVPGLINYQGRLTNPDGSPITGSRDMRFSLYTSASGSAAVWKETQSVTLSDSSFSVALGTYSSIDAPLFIEDALYLGIKVGSDAEMTPRQRLMSVGYAFRAVSAVNADNATNATNAVNATNATNATNASNADTVDGKHSTDLVLSASHTKAAHDAMGLNADLVDSMHAADIIDAAADEVRTPISSVPFAVNLPGSYYFTGDLTYSSTTGNAISVNSSDVTIDMMGYTLHGPGKTSGSNNGIYSYAVGNVEVRNGTVENFGGYGIREAHSNGAGHRVINVRVIYNGGAGISLAGTSNLIKDCTSVDNGSYGIQCSAGTTLTGNTANLNNADGINCGSGCTIEGNTAHKNGSRGIYALYGCTIEGNTVYQNSSHGIQGLSACNIIGNTAYLNTGNGISGGGGSTISGNSSYQNSIDGISGSSGCVISGNTVKNSGEVGIYGYEACTITGNASYYNAKSGIYAYNGCTVTGNTVRFNNVSDNSYEGGIRVDYRCVVKNNTLTSNYVVNIFVQYNDNAVEENLVTGSSGYGIYFSTFGNFLMNNRASGNSFGDYYNIAGQTDGGGNVSF